jgi:hypothetical protein
MNIED